MPGSVRLEITAGPMAGKKYRCDDHMTVLCGRHENCPLCLAEDPGISRHHFLLEINPPEARLQDLDSSNGTYLNGKRIGDQPGAANAGVDLRDGDVVQAGTTTLCIRISSWEVCCRCDVRVAAAELAASTDDQGRVICSGCRLEAQESPTGPVDAPTDLCSSCGAALVPAADPATRGQDLCPQCADDSHETADELVELVQQFASGSRVRRDDREFQGFDVVRKLGAGGMGEVYLARHRQVGTKVAIKLIPVRQTLTRKRRQSFTREIQVLEALRHDNIVRFLEAGANHTVYYFVMEFCDGGTLKDLLKRHAGRLPMHRAKTIMLEVLTGLAYAHEHNCVHRDIKPENILLAGSPDRQVVKISDFGLAKNFALAGLSGMTATGAYAGTPHYMPSEQLIDYRYIQPTSDVWSCGATFYRMLTGQLPRDFGRGQNCLRVVLEGEIIPLRVRAPELPETVAAVIDRALASEPDDRYQNAGSMLAALRAVL